MPLAIATCPSCGQPIDTPNQGEIGVDADTPNQGEEIVSLRSTSSKSSSKARGKNKNYSPKFEMWWAVYPRHEEKLAAARAYEKALLLTTHKTLVDAATRYAADPNRDETYTKLPATWLNKGCWEDAPLPSRNGHRPSSADRIRRMAEEAKTEEEGR